MHGGLCAAHTSRDTAGTVQVLLTFPMTLLCSSVPANHGSGTTSRREQCQDPETEAAKWNSADIAFIIHTRAVTVDTCQNVLKRDVTNRCNALVCYKSKSTLNHIRRAKANTDHQSLLEMTGNWLSIPTFPPPYQLYQQPADRKPAGF